MNLTNDNPLGCHQVAACGGLDTMASLIVGHYPLFQSHLFTSGRQKGNGTHLDLANIRSSSDDHSDEALSDQDLDLLVVILGVLVNLVEKDTGNRIWCSLINCNHKDFMLLLAIMVSRPSLVETMEKDAIVSLQYAMCDCIYLVLIIAHCVSHYEVLEGVWMKL
eukprot:Gb_07895 [translate_table: standard]